MSSLIAWAIIGLIFFIGIVLEHDRWDRTDILQVVPAMVAVMLLWPFGLAFRVWCDLRKESCHG